MKMGYSRRHREELGSLISGNEMDFLCRKSSRKKEAELSVIQGVFEGGKGPKFMSFYPGIGGGISKVQCGMILTHEGGFASPIRDYFATSFRI